MTSVEIIITFPEIVPSSKNLYERYSAELISHHSATDNILFFFRYESLIRVVNKNHVRFLHAGEVQNLPVPEMQILHAERP